jgi:hypothetical protein
MPEVERASSKIPAFTDVHYKRLSHRAMRLSYIREISAVVPAVLVSTSAEYGDCIFKGVTASYSVFIDVWALRRVRRQYSFLGSQGQ